MELLKLLLLNNFFKAIGVTILYAAFVSNAYWVVYYDALSLNLFQFASVSDLPGLALSKVQSFIKLAGFLVLPPLLFGVLWADGHQKKSDSPVPATTAYVVAVLAVIVGIPGVTGQAARNDAAMVLGRMDRLWIKTLDKPLRVIVATKADGEFQEHRWIGATSRFVFLLSDDCSRRIIPVDDVKTMRFVTRPAGPRKNTSGPPRERC